MGKNALHNNILKFILDSIGLVAIGLLFLLKWIGDFVIGVGNTVLQASIKAYNLGTSLFHRSHPKHPIHKHVSIDKRASHHSSSMKSYRRSWFHFPHLFTFSPGIQLFFIKLKFFFFGACVVFIIFTIFYFNSLLASLPNPVALNTRDVIATTKIYDRNGKLLYEIYADQNRTPMALADIPKHVKDATIATEDKNFYTHQGFSFRGIFRALYHNITSESIEGGSTITQQLIRSSFLTQERTFTRKIKEIFLSVWAEQLYTKDQILEMYLNQVPYGGTAWGIEAASQTYFGKSVQDLSVAEAALLAGLPAAPSRFSPFGPHPEYAKQRQEDSLNRMVKNGYISLEEAEQAKKEPLYFRSPRAAIAAPHFVMYVKELLEQEYGTKLVETGGLRVTTTLDLSVNNMAQEIVASQVDAIRNLSVGNGAALITNPATGEILAMIGSTDYFDQERNGNVNVTLALRQPGSTIKVIPYAAALQLGYTPATLLDDSPTAYQFGTSVYAPVNYDGRFHGRVPLRVALGSSYNVPAVKTLAFIGVDKMVAQGKLMGITSWKDPGTYGLSLALGSGEVTMLELAKVYGTLAAEGVRHDLTPFIKVTNYKGENLPLPTLRNPVRALPPSVAFLMSDILSDNAARTPAFGPTSALVIPGKTVAVKTGTSDEKRNNWTAGYTPDYVVTVWVGNNDNSPMNPSLTSGVTGAAPIWQAIMMNLLKEKPNKPFSQPPDVVKQNCNGKTEYFIAGTQPKTVCPVGSPAVSPGR